MSSVDPAKTLRSDFSSLPNKDEWLSYIDLATRALGKQRGFAKVGSDSVDSQLTDEKVCELAVSIQGLGRALNELQGIPKTGNFDKKLQQWAEKGYSRGLTHHLFPPGVTDLQVLKTATSILFDGRQLVITASPIELGKLSLLLEKLAKRDPGQSEEEKQIRYNGFLKELYADGNKGGLIISTLIDAAPQGAIEEKLEQLRCLIEGVIPPSSMHYVVPPEADEKEGLEEFLSITEKGEAGDYKDYVEMLRDGYAPKSYAAISRFIMDDPSPEHCETEFARLKNMVKTLCLLT